MPQIIKDLLTAVQSSGETYAENQGKDNIYALSPFITQSGATITIIDDEGNNSLQLPNGLKITSSIVVGNELLLTLDNGSTVNLRGADKFSYDVGGNSILGINATLKNYTDFVTDVLATTLPVAGEAASQGGGVTIAVNEDQLSSVAPLTPVDNSGVIFIRDPFTVLQSSGGTYVGRNDNEDNTYQVNNFLTQPGSTIVLTDTKGNNTLQLPAGLEISSSIVVANELVLTLANGAVINVRGADNFSYDVAGEDFNDITGSQLDFSDFVTTILGTSIPTTGVSRGDAVTIGGDSTPQPTTINLSASDATTQQGIDGIAETFIYEIDSSNFAVESRETGDISLQGFNIAEDRLIFEDVATGTTSTASFIIEAIIETDEVSTQIIFDMVIIDNPDIVIAEEGFSLTLVGVNDFSTVDYLVA